MGHGVVGGSLYWQAGAAEGVAQLALRVLRGEPADSIPVSVLDLNVSQVDWRQLRRWGIPESRVPAGTLVKFEEPSVWDRYKVYILGAIAAPDRADGAHRGAARPEIETATRRGRGPRKSGGAAHRATSDIRDLGARLLEAQESERARIARELHDDISQQMALLSIDLALLNRGMQPEREKLAGEALDRAQVIAKSVHDLSHRLHPAKLRLIGLVAALQGLQQELSQSGVAITLTHDNIPSALAPDLTLCLFRIVQEALQNAVKHSGARHADVRLRGGPDGLTLIVTDDGAGFDVKAVWGKGLGLVSMAERVEAVGGTLDIRSSPAPAPGWRSGCLSASYTLRKR